MRRSMYRLYDMNKWDYDMRKSKVMRVESRYVVGKLAQPEILRSSAGIHETVGKDKSCP